MGKNVYDIKLFLSSILVRLIWLGKVGDSTSIIAYAEWGSLQDEVSGRQQWTITPAQGGGYTIQVLIGRSGCATTNTFLTADACGTNLLSLTGAANGLNTWDLTAVAAPAIVPQAAFIPLIPNGNYYIQSQGRAGCENIWNYANDCSNNNFYNTVGPGNSLAPR